MAAEVTRTGAHCEFWGTVPQFTSASSTHQCYLKVTDAPTRAPTRSPTRSPTSPTKSPTAAPWPLTYKFKCDTQGDDCAGYWGANGRASRGIGTHTAATWKVESCGDAAKVVYDSMPPNSSVYLPRWEGYMRGSVGSLTSKAVYQFAHPTKYAEEPAPSKFTGNWASQACVDGADSCTAGLNYDPTSNQCANDLSGWLTNKTSHQNCGYVRMKCAEHKIYQWKTGAVDLKDVAFLPTTDTNMEKYSETGGFNKNCYTYTYAFKKWMECKASSTTTDSQGIVTPSAWDCKSEKRCDCISCTKGSIVASVSAPCNCDDIPASVNAAAIGMCAES